ncbi:hypothetical protein LSAT2_009432 [Lamellibrachia satsuma]|nr:hypothetical protein LSAT2_009432 [Lamellibrachia satsuma]
MVVCGNTNKLSIGMRSPAMDSRDALKLHIPGKETPTQQDVNPQLLRLPSNGAVSPSSPPVLTVEELAQDEARMQQFLTSNYHLLCKRIFMSLDLFFSWLRSCGIFTIHDQELVEHTYPIKLDKAGHLIDIITYNKGSAGFKAFMEVIEYEFPYVFTHIMGRKPGKPPPEYRGSVHMEGSIKQHSRTFWDQASEDMEKVTSRVNGEIMQRFKAMALRAQETERMTLNSLQEEIVTLREEKVNLESLAAKYRLERDEGCAKCRQFQQQKDVSNKKVVELSQQVNQQQTELSRLKSGHWENDVRGSLKAPQKDDLLKKIQHMIDENSSAQEHHDKEVQEQLEQLKHERDHLYNLWQQEKGKREHAFIECSYYLEKSKQLENEMKQLIDVAYTSPRDRACNLKDRKDLPSVISKKLVTPSTEVPTSFFANDVDTGFVDIGSDWNGLTRHKTHLLFRHPQSMVETERSTFRQHPSATGDHRRSAYLSPFPIQVMQKFLDTTLLVPRLSFRGLASETVEVDADLLRRHITLVGGSYTGIFVDDIGKANDPCTSLTVGDQILKMGQSVQDMYYIDGMTLEQVLLLLKRFSGPVTLCKLSNISGLGKLHNARENHEIIHGDCFCVVIEKTIASNDADWLSLERGNIVMVTETVHGATWNCKSCWFGVKLNHKNANLLQSGCLPSEQK